MLRAYYEAIGYASWKPGLACAPIHIEVIVADGKLQAAKRGGDSVFNVNGASAINQNDTIACFLLQS